MSWLAVDVGGAHLKVSDGATYARSRSFPLWQRPDDLEHELRFAIAEAPSSDHLAVTMTGELADCFATKKEGVQHIIAAVQSRRRRASYTHLLAGWPLHDAGRGCPRAGCCSSS